MTQFQKEITEKVLAKFGDDESVKSLVRAYKYEVDDEGDRDTFYAKKLEEYLNSFSCNYDKFLEHFEFRCHRYLQAEFLKLVLKTIQRMGSIDEKNTDGRNEYMVGRMRELKQLCEDNDFIL